jgi:hypothetical protein
MEMIQVRSSAIRAVGYDQRDGCGSLLSKGTVMTSAVFRSMYTMD